MEEYYYKNDNGEIFGPISKDRLLDQVNSSTMILLSTNSDIKVNWFPCEYLFIDKEEPNLVDLSEKNLIVEEEKLTEKETRIKVNPFFPILTIIGVSVGTYFFSMAILADSAPKQCAAGIFACASVILPYCLQKAVKDL